MEHSAAAGQVNIRIQSFFPQLANVKDVNSPIVDWIEYYPATQAGNTLIRRPVSELLDIGELHDPQNLMQVIAHQRKRLVEQSYAAYKDGMKVPVNGMPLAAWTAVTKQHAEIIAFSGIRSVEELADATDSMIALIKLPNPHDLRTLAQRWISGKDASAAAKRVEDAENQAAAQREQMAEMMRLVQSMQAELVSLRASKEETAKEETAKEEEEPPPVRRGLGRPARLPMSVSEPAIGELA